MDDFSALANPEEIFFQSGYADGYAHGRIHGLIEGRAVGKEKGLELWEEVGYYRGFATIWQATYDRKKDNLNTESRIAHHIKFILAAINRFPLVNPSTLSVVEQQETTDELDIAKLLSQIRSRYKALCAILGVKPRLRSVASGEEAVDPDEDIFGPKKLRGDDDVDSNTIWKLEKSTGTQPLIY